MTLGYLMAPRVGTQQTPNEVKERLDFARNLGFSEFYRISQDGPFEEPQQQEVCLERAQSLCVQPEFTTAPLLKVVTVDGKRQHSQEQADNIATAIPTETVQQVISNAHQQLPTLSVSWLDRTTLAQHWAAHVTACTHKGQRAQPENWKIARTIIACDDPARAEAAVFAAQSPCRAYYTKAARSVGLDVEAMMNACVIHGTLDRVLDELQILKETCGPFGTLTLVDHAWPDQEMAQHSIAALGSALVPPPKRSWALR